MRDSSIDHTVLHNSDERQDRVPQVTVVISAYNAQSVIDRAIQSIVDQSLTDWELIIVNDGSTDQTGDCLDRWAAVEDRIRIVHTPNRGLTLALIDGCQAARSPYIARQDADDWSAPNRLAMQYELLQSRPEIGFVSCHTEYVGPAGEPLETVRRPGDADLATERLLNDRLGPPAHGSVMFRQELYRTVGGYRSAFYYAQDSDLWLRMAECSKIAYVDKPLYTFVRGLDSISGKHRHVQRQFGVFGQACKDSRLAGDSEQTHLDQAEALSRRLRSGHSFSVSRSAASSARYLIGTQLLHNGNPAARGYLWDAIRANPLNGRAWVRWVQSLGTHSDEGSS